MIRFLIESSVCLGLFYGVYWLFLRKEKFLSVNRFFLLGAVIISMIVPLLEFSFQPEWASTVQVLQITPFIDSAEIAEPGAARNSIDIISLVYFSGLVISVLLLLVKIRLTQKKLGLSFLKRKRGIQVVNVEGYHAFSFWNTIVLGKKIEDNSELKDQVLSHEMAHVKGKHSLDLLLMELLKCMYWFNPFIYFSASSLKTQHEYIADQYVLRKFSPGAYERSLATIILAKIDQSLVHGFNKLPIDRRIKMIYTTNSNIMNKFKLLFALPILALLVFQFSCADDPFKSSDEVPDQGMTAKLVRSIYTYNVKTDVVTTDGDEVRKDVTTDALETRINGVMLEGVVTDINGIELSGVKVKTSSSEVETISGDDGKFSLMVKSDDQELILTHPDRLLSKVALGEYPEMETIDIFEVPVEMGIGDSEAASKILNRYNYRVKALSESLEKKAGGETIYEIVEGTAETPLIRENLKIDQSKLHKVNEVLVKGVLKENN